MRPPRLSSLALVAAAGLAAPTAAQVDPFASPPRRVLEVISRSRWIHAAQHPASVHFVESTDRFEFRVHRIPSLSGLTYRFEGRGLEGNVTTDERNVVTQLAAVPPTVRYRLDREPGIDGMRPRAPGGIQIHGQLATVDARLWDVPVPLPGTEVRTGARWSDRTRLQVGSGAETEFIDLTWRFLADRDTAVDGRRLPIVRVEAEVVYRESRPWGDGARRTHTTIEREGRGRLGGWILLDPALGLRAGGADTLRLEGTSTLVLQDGRRFVEPAHFERTRTFTLFDSAGWSGERERRRAESSRTRGGMVIPARSRDGVTDAVLDSLWSVWEATDDPDERLSTARHLSWASGLDPNAFPEELRRRLLALGDSGAALEGLPSGPARGMPLTVERWREVAPFLHDPGRAWRWGLHPRWTYTGLASAFLASSSVAGTDPEDWACMPSACEAIVAEMTSSPEPRLQEVGAVARFARTPSTVWPELVALHGAGSEVVTEAVDYGRGVGATWPAASGLGMPGSDEGWRSWLEWMGGAVRVDESHRMALRFFSARTDRDPLDDLSEAWPSLEGDSARLVVGSLLRAVDRIPPSTADEVRADLLSQSAVLADAARRQLAPLLGTADTVPGSEATAFLAPVLDSMLAGGGAPWPVEEAVGRRIRLGQGFHGAREVPVYVPEKALPPELLEGRALTPIDSATWADRDRREGAVLLDFAPVRRVGDLVHVDWTWSAWLPRDAEEAPQGYAGGESLWLARTESGWVVVQFGGWIT